MYSIHIHADVFTRNALVPVLAPLVPYGSRPGGPRAQGPPKALVGRALGPWGPPLGLFGLGPCGPLWALVGLALVGPPAPLPAWDLMGRDLMGTPGTPRTKRYI